MQLYAMIFFAALGQIIETPEPPAYSTLLQQARAQYHAGQLSAAEKLFNEALAQVGNDPGIRRALTLASLGDVYASQEKLTQAERAYSESLSIYRSFADTRGITLMLHNLAIIKSLGGSYDPALKLLSEALKTVKSLPRPDDTLMAQVLNGMGVIYYRKGNNGKAEALFKQSLEISSTPGVHFDTARVLNNLGTVYLARRKFKEAEYALKQALELKQAEVGLLDTDLIVMLNSLGGLYTTTRRYAEAEDQFRHALAIVEPRTSDFAPTIARLQHALCIMYMKAGRKVESDAALARAADIARNNLDKEAEMATIVEEYSALLKKRGQTAEAEVLRQEAKRARAAAGLTVNARTWF